MLMNAAIKYLKKQVPPYRLHKAIQYQSIFKRNKRAAWSPVEVSQQDLAFLQYTGGTTGVAKGAMLTHGNMIANMQQACAWISPNLTFGKEVIITALPLYHIFALTANCLTFAKFGALNYLITNPRDLKGFVKELNSVAFTAMTGVNTLFNGLLHTPGFKSLDFSHFKMTLGGGMAVQQVVANQWQEVTGVTLVEAYGLTETSPAVCMNPMNLSAYNGSIGLPIPMTDCRVCDDQDNILAIGEAGELQVHGPQVMLGYWNKEEETKKVFTQDGWLRTGDIATMDEQGYLRIVDRKKDMILVSGFNVYPNEVEAVIAEHPMVLEVGVIGVDDAKTTEAVMAVVVRKDPALTVAQLRTFCKTQLTGYKVPKHIEFRNEIPKTNVGKILRRALRDSITQQ